MRYALGLFAGLVLSGCFQDFAWKRIVDAEAAPLVFSWRGEDELWGHGRGVVRRVNGVWERLDLCGEHGVRASGVAKSGPTVAFGSGKEVWALCGLTASEGQVLVHIDGKGKAKTRTLPDDGTLTLVQLAGDVALLGTTTFYKRAGDAFEAVGAHPIWSGLPDGATGDPVVALGRSLQDIYVAADDGLWHRSGESWSLLKPSQGRGTLTQRGTQFFLAHHTEGFFRLEPSGPVDLLGPIAKTAAGKRRVVPVGTLAPDRLVFLGTPPAHLELGGEGGFLWMGDPADDDLTYLGSITFYRSGGLWTGGSGGFAYAIDESTILAYAGDGLYEGSR